jgi:hypothetical protein
MYSVMANKTEPLNRSYLCVERTECKAFCDLELEGIKVAAGFPARHLNTSDNPVGEPTTFKRSGPRSPEEASESA